MSTEKESVGQLQALAYERLSLFFSSHQDKRIEIEILPPAFQPPDGILMEDGFSLGIPKKILALAYIEARKTFFMNRHAADETSQSDALLATKTMLLFDPEHLTAANFRKRNLLALKTQKSLTAQFHRYIVNPNLQPCGIIVSGSWTSMIQTIRRPRVMELHGFGPRRLMRFADPVNSIQRITMLGSMLGGWLEELAMTLLFVKLPREPRIGALNTPVTYLAGPSSFTCFSK